MGTTMTKRKMRRKRKMKVDCLNDEDPEFRCDEIPCLFNVRKDPCEQKDLSSSLPLLHRRMLKHLETHELLAAPPANLAEDPRADPDLHAGVWGPWIKL